MLQTALFSRLLTRSLNRKTTRNCLHAATTRSRSVLGVKVARSLGVRSSHHVHCTAAKRTLVGISVNFHSHAEGTGNDGGGDEESGAVESSSAGGDPSGAVETENERTKNVNTCTSPTSEVASVERPSTAGDVRTIAESETTGADHDAQAPTERSVGHYSIDELLDFIAKAQLQKNEQVVQPQVKSEKRKLKVRRLNLLTIDELVEFLRDENARDICVIKIPAEQEYVDYFVVCGGMGTRHIRMIADNLVAEVRGGGVGREWRESDGYIALCSGQGRRIEWERLA